MMNFMKTIHSAQNEQLKQLNKVLNQSKTRRQLGLAALEGVHLLESFLQTGQVPLYIYIPENRFHHPEVQALINRLPENIQREYCVLVGKGLLSKITTLNQAEDIISLIKLPTLNNKLPESGDCVVLENVQDPGNIGTILRSAAAAGVKNIILGKGCADAFSPKVLRSGMGAHFLLNITEQADLQAWATQYQHPILITLLNANSIGLYQNLPLKTPCAWVFGNEGSGVSPDLAKCATYAVSIPMLGAVESLNVAMAATVCLFEQMRQRLETVANP